VLPFRESNEKGRGLAEQMKLACVFTLVSTLSAMRRGKGREAGFDTRLTPRHLNGCQVCLPVDRESSLSDTLNAKFMHVGDCT
jgi:hypothetical protein